MHSQRFAINGMILLALLALAAPSAWTRPAVPEHLGAADKAMVVDGTAVLNAGRIHANITNWGLIGSHFGTTTTYGDAPSVQWPGGSGEEYVYAAGLWIGGRQNGTLSVTTGQFETELLPAPGVENVLYEARDNHIAAPVPGAVPTGVPGDLPGGDDDGDGRIDEDFAQLGSQMFTCLMRDDTALAGQLYPDHRPLGVEVRFTACAWNTTDEQDLIGLRWVIRNAGLQPIEDLYVGLLVDGSVGRHDDGAAGRDDLAGLFRGLVRRREGGFADLQYAWMRDADPDGPLPGWLGVTLEGTGFGDRDAVRPDTFGLNAMRIMSLAHGHDYRTLPVSDDERYYALAREFTDPDVSPNRLGDYVVLLSVGPWTVLEPGQHVIVNATLTVAPGEDALRDAMLANEQTAWGRWYDADRDWRSGRYGRESLVCAEDFYSPWNDSRNPLYRHYRDYWNPACRPANLLAFPIVPDDLTYYSELGKHCLWVSKDNCEECRRFNGVVCTSETEFRYPCFSNSPAARLACTGMQGREANIPFSRGTLPPTVPRLRVVPYDRAVEVYWDDRSERTIDRLHGLDDFESYRIWRADDWDRPPGSTLRTGPSPEAWRLIAEYDRVNYLQTAEDQPPLMFGPNTGFADVHYRPACLDDPRFAGLAEAMQDLVLADVTGSHVVRPFLRDRHGRPISGLEALLPWEAHPDVLDTFFAVTGRPDTVGVPKEAVRYYRYRDEEVHNGFLYFYSVTATDHVPTPDGTSVLAEGIGSLPSGHFVTVQPRYQAVDAALPRDEQPRPFVFPNPATRASLAEFQAMHPALNDPTGMKVSFTNLPHCRCTIRVFTLAGDLVQTLEHDGAQGNGQAYWNLISRNGQEITAGIYLFTVSPHDGRYTEQVGKFVVML